jgi:branched-chain amino acid transport system substrate-binding protein
MKVRVNKNSTSRHLYLPCALLIFSVFSLLVSCQQNQPDEKPVKIGVIAYLQGAFAETEGHPTENAARMALRDFEAKGGLVINGQKKRIELIVEGIERSSEASVASARKLINRDGVVAVVGPQYSSDAIPAGAIAEMSLVPMICPVSTNPATTKDRKFVFRMSFLDPVQGEAMANLAFVDLEARRAAVLFDEADEYSRGIAEVFQNIFIEYGGSVTVEKYIPGDGDLKDKLTRIRLAQPDVLFLPSFHDQVVEQVALARQLGIKSTILGADGWDQRAVPGLANFDKSYFSVHWSPLVKSEQNLLFNKEYQNVYSSEPNGTAALTYDALQMILAAMQQQQKTDPDSIRNGLMELPTYPGVGGEVDFVASGDPEKGVLILHVRNGTAEFFKYLK